MASEAPRVAELQNEAGIINTIMLRYQLHNKDIKDAKRYADVHGRGEFFCTACNYTWHSYFSWMRIDLLDQRISYRWSMKCKTCMNIHKPKFSLPELEKLTEKAVCWYLDKRYHNPNAQNGGRRKFYEYIEPHLPVLCEKCGWGQKECWR